MKRVIKPETVAPHPAEFPTASLIRVAHQHAALVDTLGQTRLAALLRELAKRLDVASRTARRPN
jgi:hypothetical protein